MKILIASQSYDLSSNGQAVFSVHLAEGLARRGHQVLVVRPNKASVFQRKSIKGVQIVGIKSLSLEPAFPGVLVSLFPGQPVSRVLDEFAPDLVHIQDHYPLCRSVTAQAKKRGLPLLGTNHFLPQNIAPYVPLLPHLPGGPQALQKILWHSVMGVFQQMDAVTVPSATAAGILRQQGLLVPIYPISCGVDLDQFKPSARLMWAVTRQKYNLFPLSRVFLYVGRLDLEKRVDVLIRAWSLLDFQDAQLAIAGRGNHERQLHKLVAKLGLDDRVIFLGFIPRSDLPALLSSVDYFAMPSDVELQSIATLEALASGKPVLAAKACALPELVREGVNGSLFIPNNAADAARAARRLLDQPQKWQSMSAASLRLAQDHSLEETVDRYLALYHQVGTTIRETRQVSQHRGRHPHDHRGVGQPS